MSHNRAEAGQPKKLRRARADTAGMGAKRTTAGDLRTASERLRE